VATIAGRLLIALLTFLLSMAAHRMFTAAGRVQPATDAELPFRTKITAAVAGETKRSRTRISQQSDVYFKDIGLVTISAREDIGTTPRLVFTNESGQNVYEAYVHSDWEYLDDDHSGLNPSLRFTVQNLRGITSPLVIAVAMQPGGSDNAWESFAVGVVDGRFAQLTFEHLKTDDDGGFFFGDLGNGIGPGAAQWNFIWGEDEGHPPPHRYEIRLYKWNGRRFEWESVRRTRGQFNCARDAVNALGFHFADMRANFTDWSYLADWTELCKRN
jgi:hypothetical protein